MDITVSIPDDLATKLGTEADLPRRVLEAVLLEEYRAGRLARPELSRALGFETRYEMDGFLKDRGVYDGITIEEFDRQMRDLDRHPAADEFVARFQAFAAVHTLGGLDIKDLISEGRR